MVSSDHHTRSLFPTDRRCSAPTSPIPAPVNSSTLSFDMVILRCKSVGARACPTESWPRLASLSHSKKNEGRVFKVSVYKNVFFMESDKMSDRSFPFWKLRSLHDPHFSCIWDTLQDGVALSAFAGVKTFSCLAGRNTDLLDMQKLKVAKREDGSVWILGHGAFGQVSLLLREDES